MKTSEASSHYRAGATVKSVQLQGLSAVVSSWLACAAGADSAVVGSSREGGRLELDFVTASQRLTRIQIGPDGPPSVVAEPGAVGRPDGPGLHILSVSAGPDALEVTWTDGLVESIPCYLGRKDSGWWVDMPAVTWQVIDDLDPGLCPFAAEVRDWVEAHLSNQPWAEARAGLWAFRKALRDPGSTPVAEALKLLASLREALGAADPPELPGPRPLLRPVAAIRTELDAILGVARPLGVPIPYVEATVVLALARGYKSCTVSAGLNHVRPTTGRDLIGHKYSQMTISP